MTPSGGGGILPPPPPPPPPPLQKLDQDATTSVGELSVFDKDSDNSSNIAKVVLSAESSSLIDDHSSDDETSSSKQATGDAATEASSNSETSFENSQEKMIHQPEGEDNTTEATPVIKDTSSLFSETNNDSWRDERDRVDGSVQPSQWGDQTQSQQYTNNNNQQSMNWNQEQSQPYQSWDRQQYQQHQQQQQYHQYQQHQQQYPQQYHRQQPPNNQLTIYNNPRRPTSSAGATASRFFSLAAKKLQTGIDSVSETLDTNNLASSVSSLTSRIGSNINSISGAITGQTEALRSGGARRMAPPSQMMRPPPMQGGGPRRANVPPQSRQSFPQQRMTSSRGPMKANTVENYAPPMSELYSLESQTTAGDVERTTDTNNDDTDSDIEDETIMQSESTPLPFSSTAIPQHQLNPSQTSQYQSNPVPNSSYDGNRRMSPSTSQPTRRPYENFDDEEDSSFGGKIKAALGSVPLPRMPKFSRSDDFMFDDGSWSDDESSEKSGGLFRRTKPSPSIAASRSSSAGGNRMVSGNAAVPRPVVSLLEKRDTLLSPSTTRKCKSIGRYQAALDSIQLVFVLLALREIVPLFLNELSSFDSTVTLQKKMRTVTLSTIFSAIEGWAPYAIAAAFLVSLSNSSWIQPMLTGTATEAASQSASDEVYSQLYLRLISSLPMQSFSSDALRKATKDQALYVSSLARLRFFVTIAVTVVIVSTVAVLRPAGTAVISAAIQLWQPSIDIVKSSPIDWSLLWDVVKRAGLDLAGDLHKLFNAELALIRQEPLRVAVVVSLIGTMMAVSYLPALEKRRKPAAGANIANDVDGSEEKDSVLSLWSNIGSSSSSRLGILSSPLGVEGALQQFSKLRPDQASHAGIVGPSRHSELLKQKRRRRRESAVYLMACRSLLRNALYFLSSSILLSIPLIAYFCVFALVQGNDGSKLSWRAVTDDGWVALLNLATLLLFAHLNTAKAAHHSIVAADSRLKHSVVSFFSKLTATASELQKLSAESSAGADFQAMMTASPTKGLVVSDFWAAHSSRKAWAVKGANVQVRNEEVVLIIGDDGAGKSRLLTGIAEYIFTPPKSARTTTYARGNMNIAGVDVSKWDRKVLQKRVGVFLNDIRAVPDYASLMSGCTLEEIIEPISVVGGQIGPKERNSMAIAMKITGLGSKVLSRLPSKLSTVVSASEDKLKPSPLRPPAYPLSPSEWSRVMLTKVLAQLISGNENQQSSAVAIKKSMIGSILLLDDASALMNETDEGKLITALRSTGAAVLLTSNRWASGRFADRIVVMSDGQVVESGTHSDLLSLGPDRSVYARQWNEMM
jgi:ABC-type multidrug transport system fused ATPase/permease subunit